MQIINKSYMKFYNQSDQSFETDFDMKCYPEIELV